MELNNKELIQGMTLLDDVILDNSVDYRLEKGHILTKRDIIRIQEKDINNINIEISSEFSTFNDIFNNLVAEAFISNDIDKIESVANLYVKIIESTDILKYDMSLYLNKKNHSHFINSINIAMILGKKYNDITTDNKINLLDLAYAALLQDIGRNAKDEFILERTRNKYTYVIEDLCSNYRKIKESIFYKYEYKYHPVYGYLLSKNYSLNDNISLAILLHHEKEYGDNSLLTKGISTLPDKDAPYIKIAQILKIADLLDSLITKNVSDNPKDPFVNLGKYIDNTVANELVDAKLGNIFKTYIPIYQVGQKVDLSDGTVAIVSDTDSYNYNNPSLVDFNGVDVDYIKENIRVIKHHKD